MKTWCKAIRYDERFGILRMWWAFLPAILWGLYMALRVDMAWTSGLEMGMIVTDQPFSFADVCLYAFGGMTEYIPSPTTPFEIPVEWLIWNVYLALLVSQYAHKNLCGIGQQMLIRFRRRHEWWGGKCVWCLTTVGLAYALLLLAMLGYTLCRGMVSPTLSPWMGEVLGCMLPPAYCSVGWGGITVLLLLTVGVSVALCQWQTTLVLFIKPLGAFIAAVVFLAAGAYILHPLLFANYAMWERSAVLGMNVFEPLTGGLLCLAFYAVAVIVGGIRFAKYDIINIQE